MDKKNRLIVFGLIALVAVSIASLSGFMVTEQSVETVSSGPPKAVIIDQLSEEFPNEFFYKKAVEYLETAGYKVDIVTTKDITVDYYKNLPEKNYKMVIVRTHGADNTEGNNVVLFTGEKYQDDKYIQEQLFGQVTKAAPLLEVAYKPADESESNWVIVNDTYSYLKSSVKKETSAENEFFAISPKLVSDSMKGKFDDTVFILGGCNTLSNPSMATSLFKRGASAVIGWDNKVGSTDNDNAILYFLQLHLTQDFDIEKSVDILRDAMNPQLMPFPANFTHYQNLV
jgi:hypothetical protein